MTKGCQKSRLETKQYPAFVSWRRPLPVCPSLWDGNECKKPMQWGYTGSCCEPKIEIPVDAWIRFARARSSFFVIKIYATSIPRFKERHAHIQSELRSKSKLIWTLIGIDALDLRQRQMDWPHSETLRDSEVGCALSHVEACRRMVSDGADFALIVEDDAILPDNIDLILEELSKNIKRGEVISLYNRTLQPEKFSNVGAKNVFGMKLIYPMETRFMRTAAAYFLDRQAAENISKYNSPVKIVADNWAAYYQSRTISSIRLLHPIPISLHPFTSTLSTDRGGSVEKTVKRLLKRSSFFLRAMELRRQAIERKRERHLILVDLPPDQLRDSYECELTLGE